MDKAHLKLQPLYLSEGVLIRELVNFGNFEETQVPLLSGREIDFEGYTNE
jgi:hypothetical protein